VRRLLADPQSGPQVCQIPAGQRPPDRDHQRTLPFLRQAEVAEEVRASAGVIPQLGKAGQQAAQMPGEPPGHQLARVLHQDDLGPQHLGIPADLPDQAIACVVADVVAGQRAGEAGAGRAGRKDRGPGHAHRGADLGRVGGCQVGLDRPDADVRLIGRVAAEGAAAGARLAQLCVGGTGDPEIGMGAEAVAHAAGPGEQVDDRPRRPGSRRHRSRHWPPPCIEQ
jgi:hypothetical protein